MPKIVSPVLPPGSMARRTQPVLTVEELVLRPWRAEDAPEVVAAYADPAIQRWHMRSVTPSEASEWVVAADRSWGDETAASWAVTGVGERLVGRMTMGAVDLDGGRADVRYWVVPAARGRRIASRALVLVTRWAFDELGLHRLELEHSVQNPRSCRVADSAGYVLEGTRCSALLHEDGWHDMHLHARVNS